MDDETFFAVTPVTMPSGRLFDVSLPAAIESSINHQADHLQQVNRWLAG